MLIHRRTPSLILPEDPSPEELLQFWTLSARDRAEVMRCRGEANRRRFAVQLCTLRAYGRFLPEVTSAPVAMTNYLGCVPPFTHSALKRAIRLMIPAVRRQLHMDPHGSNMHLSKQNQQVSDICSQS
jgi:hypothetical protein